MIYNRSIHTNKYNILGNRKQNSIFITDKQTNKEYIIQFSISILLSNFNSTEIDKLIDNKLKEIYNNENM